MDKDDEERIQKAIEEQITRALATKKVRDISVILNEQTTLFFFLASPWNSTG